MKQIALSPADGHEAHYSCCYEEEYGGENCCGYALDTGYGQWSWASSFEEGKSYHLQLNLRSENDYDISKLDLSKLHILYRDGEISTEGASLYAENPCRVSISFPSVTLPNKLNITCEIPAPQLGETPVATDIITSAAEYTCTGIRWYKSDYYDSYSEDDLMTAGQKFELGYCYFAKPEFRYDTDTYEGYSVSINASECPNGYINFGRLKQEIEIRVTLNTPVAGEKPPVNADVPSGANYSMTFKWYEDDNEDLDNPRPMEEGETFKAGHYYAADYKITIDDDKYEVIGTYINNVKNEKGYYFYGPVKEPEKKKVLPTKIDQKINTKDSYSIEYGSSLVLKPGTVTPTTYKTSNKKVATVSNKGVIKITGVGTAKISVTAAENSTYKKATKVITVNGTPKKSGISKLTPKAKSLIVKMKTSPTKLKGKSYQVAYRVKGTSKWTTKTTEKQSLTIKKLKKGKAYQVRVRAVKKVGGKTYYGPWSSVKTSKKIK